MNKNIKKLLVSEKSIRLLEDKKYVFIVDSNLSKVELKHFFKSEFDVSCKNVNTCNFKGKREDVEKFLVQLQIIKKQ